MRITHVNATAILLCLVGIAAVATKAVQRAPPGPTLPVPTAPHVIAYPAVTEAQVTSVAPALPRPPLSPEEQRRELALVAQRQRESVQNAAEMAQYEDAANQMRNLLLKQAGR